MANLREEHPGLEQSSLVYAISEQRRLPEPRREVFSFDRYSLAEDALSEDTIVTKDNFVLRTGVTFNGRTVPAFAESDFGNILPMEADAFYVGKDRIIAQLRREGLDVYVSLIEGL